MARLVVSHNDSAWAVVLEIGKPLALMAYLAAAPQQRVSREHCLDLLWADLEPDAAKHALRQTLWYIKRKLADGIITTAGDALILAAPIDSDRAALIAAVEQGDHARVVELYKGDFLPGFAAPGGAEFEQWADVERRRLRNLFYRSAEHETHRLLTSGRTREAMTLARRARDLEPLHQPAWRLLLETIIASADATSAQLEADALESLANRDDVELEPPTRALIRVARQTPNEERAESENTRALVAELVGREREFAQILAAWDDARAGRGRHIHIRAAAGLGKTRLLNDVHARLRASRARVRIARFRIGTRDVPYVAAAEVTAALADLPNAKGISPESASVLLALNPTISSVFQSGSTETALGADALRRRAVALKELLVTVSEDHPVALLLDDVHWSDEASRTLLAHLINDLDQRKLLIVTTGRPTPAGKIETPQTLTIELPPLGEHETQALITSLAALPDAAWATTFTSELLRASLGSPLRTLEMLQLLMDRALLERTEQEWRTPAPDRLMQALREGDALKHRIEQLNRSERWILLLLSVAGVPLLGSTLTALSQLSNAEYAHSLGTLEARGLIAHQGEALAPAHDEIGEAAAELATAEALRAAHSALGRHQWQQPDANLATLRRAAAHLVQAVEPAALAATYLRFVRSSRQLGDTRSHVALADEMLGGLTSASRARSLVRSLPAHVRMGLTSGRRIAAATAVAAAIPLSIALTATITLRESPPPDAELVVFTPGRPGSLDGRTIPLHAAVWNSDKSIEIPRRADLRLPVPIGAMPFEVPGPQERWMYSASVSDTGGIDVFVMQKEQPSRLTWERGDDMVLSVSPDGRYAVMATGRWNALSHYDLAVIDLTSRAVRRLTTGDESDLTGRWSPDGTQIAFIRRSFTEIGRQVCRVSFDGSDLSCLELHDASQVVGWLDETRILVVHGVDGALELTAVALDSGERISLRPDLVARDVSMAPNGRFIACLCARRGVDDWLWRVWPVGREADVRILATKGDTSSIAIGWRAPRSARDLASLTIRNSAVSLSINVPHQFTVAGVTRDGRATQPRWLRWSSTNPSTLEIDTNTGLATPHAEGTATIVVAAGGRVRAATTVQVTKPSIAELITDPWRADLNSDWLVIGTPRPYIDTVGGRVVLRPNGDGSGESGVVSRQAFAVRQGLALDAELSIRVTLPQWQVLGVAFDDIDTAAWADSDAVRGQLPGQHPVCVASFPNGENSAWADTMSLYGSPERVLAAAPKRARDGAWFRVRLQVLPDGRCGIAVNGVPVFLSKSPEAFARDPRVHVYGNSYHTDALIGRLTLRHGVPNDIDWAAFERHKRTPSAQERVSR